MSCLSSRTCKLLLRTTDVKGALEQLSENLVLHSDSARDPLRVFVVLDLILLFGPTFTNKTEFWVIFTIQSLNIYWVQKPSI